MRCLPAFRYIALRVPSTVGSARLEADYVIGSPGDYAAPAPLLTSWRLCSHCWIPVYSVWHAQQVQRVDHAHFTL